MSYYKSYRRGGGGGGSRWMALRYPGQCKVCGAAIARGQTAYWDAGARTVTCDAIECAEADGLVEVKDRWAGNPDGIKALRGYRVGSGAPTVVVSRFNSGAVSYRNARGRCIDAPCCGCCD